ncbi:hypothetical protein LTR64_002187 [Lithohypha guttulata]|uniref:NACHT domain-containing protein n=1 Tax=Lithohypha guttulata TaxID=1690604 RepID=A0AAN7STE9_9EURO|nr:hypothetical protein LTR51_001589 [Lithohypha guttulata]KAK5081004.1 hypothetical protein LTR05_008321 [Lithohypha guttulata]
MEQQERAERVAGRVSPETRLSSDWQGALGNSIVVGSSEKHTSNEILESLNFPKVRQRFYQIHDPHPGTYDWILEEQTNHAGQDFVRWLQSGRGVFWITGKPGSGKSTLMKYISESPVTLRYLAADSKKATPLILHHFFWIAGPSLARNHRGMLLTFLREILSARDTLDDTYKKHADAYVTPLAAAINRALNIDQFDLSYADLEISLLQILEDYNGSILVLVDGLDEVEGEESHSIIDFLTRLSLLPNLKLCVASRPEVWLAKPFRDAHTFRMEDMNANDISSYISQEFVGFLEFRAINDVRFASIVELLKERAEGVFLWLKFATRSLRRGIVNRDTFRQLEDRLSELPPELRDIYDVMFLNYRVGDYRHSSEITTILNILLLSREHALHLFELMVMLEDDILQYYRQYGLSVDKRILVSKCLALKGKLTTLTAGFVECRPWLDNTESGMKALYQSLDALCSDEDDESYHHTNVTFIHQSVVDYLSSTETWRPIPSIDEDKTPELRRRRLFARLACMVEAAPDSSGCVREIGLRIDSCDTSSEAEEIHTELGKMLERAQDRSFIRGENTDSGYGTAEKQETSSTSWNASSHTGRHTNDLTSLGLSEANSYELRETLDRSGGIQPVAKNDEDIQSLVRGPRPPITIYFEKHLLQTLCAQDALIRVCQVLRSSYSESNISDTLLERDLTEILKYYFIDARDNARSNGEYASAQIVRSRAYRCKLAGKLLRRSTNLDIDEDSPVESEDDDPNTKMSMGMSRQEVNDWLQGNPGFNQTQPSETPELIPEDDVKDSGSTIIEHEVDDGNDDYMQSEMHSEDFVQRMENYMVKGDAYKLLIERAYSQTIGAKFHSLRRVLLSLPRQNITFYFNPSSSWLDQAIIAAILITGTFHGTTLSACKNCLT